MSMRLQRRHLVSLGALLVIATSPALLTAQVPSPPGPVPSRSTKPPAQVPSAPGAPEATVTIQQTERKLGLTSMAGARGVRLLLQNRTTGRIIVHGWDRDVVEARAFSERGEEVLMIAQKEDEGPGIIFLKADYANRDNS